MGARLLGALLMTMALCAPLAPAHAASWTLVGEVVKVSDGDTVTLMDAEQASHKIRLAGIDAPERKQPWGQDARLALVTSVLHQTVSASCSKVDRYRRDVCTLRRGDVDLNLAQVQAGLAWHYLAYAREQSPADALAYAEAELQARQASRGLWSDAQPVPPWVWRDDKSSHAGAVAPLKAPAAP